MDILYSIVSVLGLMAVGIGTAELLCRFAPKLAAPKVPENYNSSLHGLRGLLAIAIAVHACWAWYGYGRTGKWMAPSMVIENVGRLSALLFFAISGFLYWERLRSGAFELRAFYKSRLRRLVPTYLVLMGLLLVVALVRGEFSLKVTADVFAKQMIPYLSLGLLGDFGKINEANMNLVHGASLWCLGTLFLFYLSLPFLAWFTRGHRVWGLLAGAAGLALLPKGYLTSDAGRFLKDLAALYYPTYGFAVGILAAYLMKQTTASRLLRHPVAPFVAAGCLIALLWAERITLFRPSVLTGVLTLGFFAVMANGAVTWKLLTHRSVAWLGTISYSLFLFHGITVYLMTRMLPETVSLKQLTWGQSFLFFGLASVLCVVVGSLVFKYLEMRFAGRRSRDVNNVTYLRRAA